MASNKRFQPASSAQVDALRRDTHEQIDALRQEMHEQIAALRQDFDSKFNRIAVEIIQLREQMATRDDIKELKDSLNRIMNFIDSINAGNQDNRRSILVHSDILDGHDKGSLRNN